MILDILVIATIIIFGVLGYTRGFIKSAMSLIKVSTSVIIAILLCKPFAKLLDNIFGLAKFCAKAFNKEPADGNLILIAISALIIFIIIRVILRFINKLATNAKQNVIANRADSWFGFVFGIVRFCFVFCIFAAVVYIVTAIPFLDGIHTWLFKDSTIALWLYNIATDLLFSKLLSAASQAIGL